MSSHAPPTLVFFAGALGDSVLSWPLLRALDEAAYIGPLSKSRLAAWCLPHVSPVDGERPDFARLFAPGAQIEVADDVRRLLGGAARIISFISDGRDAWAANVRTLAPQAQLLFVRSRPPDGRIIRIHEFHQRQLAEQGMGYGPVLPARRANPDGPVIIHGGSGGAAKCWPADRIERLVRHFQRIGRELLVTIGEVERDRLSADVLRRWRDEFDVVEPDDPIELAQRLSRAAVVIAPDSGPAHLAAQLGVAVVALFGPSDSRIWAPFGPAVTVLAPPEPAPMTWLEVEAVIEAAARW